MMRATSLRSKTLNTFIGFAYRIPHRGIQVFPVIKHSTQKRIVHQVQAVGENSQHIAVDAFSNTPST